MFAAGMGRQPPCRQAGTSSSAGIGPPQSMTAGLCLPTPPAPPRRARLQSAALRGQGRISAADVRHAAATRVGPSHGCHWATLWSGASMFRSRAQNRTQRLTIRGIAPGEVPNQQTSCAGSCSKLRHDPCQAEAAFLRQRCPPGPEKAVRRCPLDAFIHEAPCSGPELASGSGRSTHFGPRFHTERGDAHGLAARRRR